MAIKLLPPRPGNGNYRIRGKIRGRYINEATGTTDRGRAEAIRIKRERELLDESVFGARVSRTFAQAARDYVEKENPRGTQRDAVIGRRRKDGDPVPVPRQRLQRSPDLHDRSGRMRYGSLRPSDAESRRGASQGPPCGQTLFHRATAYFS